jgi:thiol-disulfide isomerase/thioredoxin
MRRLLWILGVVVLTIVVVVGVRQAGGSDSDTLPALSLSDMQQQLRGAPPALASLYAQPNELLDGGKSAFKERLAKLEGHPLVVNKWASWCQPCRAEFPIFERQAAKRGKDIGFLAVNGKDKAPAAKRFLNEYPLPYPSYEDPHEAIATELNVPTFYPMTLFLDAKGRTRYIHPGVYKTEDDLAADIDRYLK